MASCFLAAAVFCAMLAPAAAPASEPDPIMTGSLPGAGGAALHGRWITKPRESRPGRLLVLGFAGDLGFSGKDQPLSTAGAVRHGRVIPWDELFSGVAPLLEADATLANLETVISDRADLLSVEKSFNFVASPEGLKSAVRAGINVIAAANNHAADYGEGGIADTLRHLETAKADGLKVHAGLGRGDERYRAGVFDLHGITVGLSAVGKGINPAGSQGYGQPLYASQPDFDRVSAALGATDADIRILSVHYGEELNLLPAAADRKRLRSAVDRGNATIVFGHHSHVASGVERRDGGLILYGLGNFLHAGTQNMARYGQCRDFGLHARVYLWVAPGSKPVLRAVEITPLRDMHEIARPFPVEQAATRVAVVNAMSEELTRDGGDPLVFTPTDRGTGLACLSDPAHYGDELEARCRSMASPLMTVAAQSRASLASCKALLQLKLAKDQQKAQPDPVKAAETEGKPKKTARQSGKARTEKKDAAAEQAKAKAPRKFFLFSRAD